MRKRGKWSTTFGRWRKNDVDNVDSGAAGVRSHAFSEGVLHDLPGAGRRSKPLDWRWQIEPVMPASSTNPKAQATWRPLVAHAGYAVGFLI